MIIRNDNGMAPEKEIDGFFFYHVPINNTNNEI